MNTVKIVSDANFSRYDKKLIQLDLEVLVGEFVEVEIPFWKKYNNSYSVPVVVKRDTDGDDLVVYSPLLHDDPDNYLFFLDLDYQELSSDLEELPLEEPTTLTMLYDFDNYVCKVELGGVPFFETSLVEFEELLDATFKVDVEVPSHVEIPITINGVTYTKTISISDVLGY